MNESELFDGGEEIYHAERGATFGLSAQTYWRLAQACMSAKEFAGIQPCEIAKLDAGRPGCRVVLYGRHLLWQIEIEANTTPNRLRLSSGDLDLPRSPATALEETDTLRGWSSLVSSMLAIEGPTAKYRMLGPDEMSSYLGEKGF